MGRERTNGLRGAHVAASAFSNGLDNPSVRSISSCGKPVFGPLGPIATKAACDSAGGRFLPRVFGWMVHVNAFAGDDAKVIWAVEEHDDHMKM